MYYCGKWMPLLLAAVLPGVASAASSIVSSTNARLPGGLSAVIGDLESEGCSDVITACVLTSRSVTRKRRATLQQALLGRQQQDDEGASKAVGLASGLTLAQPSDASEAGATACACGGTIIYYPDAVDLSRGEGLFDSLAPAMEQLLAISEDNTLVVVLEGDIKSQKASFEQAAEAIVSSLIHSKSSTPVSVLQDVFSKIEYVTSPAQAVIVAERQKTTPADALDLIKEVKDSVTSPSLSSSSLSPADLAASRVMGPVGRSSLKDAVDRVKEACQDSEGGAILVPEFGALCDAAIKQALDTLEGSASGSASLSSSGYGKQIRANLQSDISAELCDLFEEQIDLQAKASFEDLRKALSRLLVSPNLKSDMDKEIAKSVAAFSKAANKLVARSSTFGGIQQIVSSAKQRYRKQLVDSCAERLLKAQAGGQFKPLPRKGVTVGMHWLLPKPFGNDFRQEPWNVHATDSMVYVPKGSKVRDVNPDQAASGDWRDEVVPSPVGNDMIFMQ